MLQRMCSSHGNGLVTAAPPVGATSVRSRRTARMSSYALRRLDEALKLPDQDRAELARRLLVVSANLATKSNVRGSRKQSGMSSQFMETGVRNMQNAGATCRTASAEEPRENG